MHETKFDALHVDFNFSFSIERILSRAHEVTDRVPSNSGCRSQNPSLH